MLSFHVFANQNPRRSTSLAPAALRPRRFRHDDDKLVTRPNFRPQLNALHPRSFFSCTYKLPIFYPLCFDIHASDGGCGGARRFLTSRWPDHKNNPLAPPERRKEIQQLLPRNILLVEQLHPVFRFRARHDFCSCFHPIAQQLAAGRARRNSHARIISDALHFSGNADRVHVQSRLARIERHRRIRREPYRRLYALAALLECFEVQIFVPCKRLKSHRLGPRNSMQGILRRTQKSRTDIPVCASRSRSSFRRSANTKSAPIQPERPLHHFEKDPYFVRTYVTSSVNESFWSLRNVQVVLK